MKNQGLRKKLLLIFLIVTVSFLGFSKEKKLNSSWEIAAIKIDSFDNAWDGESFAFNKKLNVDYAFKNDAENFYIRLIFRDQKYMSNIKTTGMTIWFNTEGKKKKNYGIRFTERQIKADELIYLLEKQQGLISDEKKNEIWMKTYHSFLSGEVISKAHKSKSSAYTSGGTKLAWFRPKKQKGMIVYEFSIPLERDSKMAQGIGTEPGKSIKVGFEWGGMTKEMRMEMMRRHAAQNNLPESCTDSGCNGGRNSKDANEKAPSYVDFSSRSSLPIAKKYSFWVDVQLAKN